MSASWASSNATARGATARLGVLRRARGDEDAVVAVAAVVPCSRACGVRDLGAALATVAAGRRGFVDAGRRTRLRGERWGDFNDLLLAGLESGSEPWLLSEKVDDPGGGDVDTRGGRVSEYRASGERDAALSLGVLPGMPRSPVPEPSPRLTTARRRIRRPLRLGDVPPSFAFALRLGLGRRGVIVVEVATAAWEACAFRRRRRLGGEGLRWGAQSLSLDTAFANAASTSKC